MTNAYESEANDTLATADAVKLGTTITGQLSTSKDKDFPESVTPFHCQVIPAEFFN